MISYVLLWLMYVVIMMLHYTNTLRLSVKDKRMITIITIFASVLIYFVRHLQTF
jgi:hypothetical protein